MTPVLHKRADTNVGENERWISLLAGAGLVAYGLAKRDRVAFGLAGIGAYVAWRGASGFCPVYQAFGASTAQRGGEQKGTGSKAGVAYQMGIRVDHELRIDKPAEELYRFWRNFENLPRFMHHLDSVQVRDDRVSHWTVRGPAGLKLEWDAEIVNEIENRLIGWRSLPGARVENGGSVHFDTADDGKTIVRIAMQYNPPAGNVGARIAKLFGEDPKEMIREDLQRFRELMETGALTSRSKAQAQSTKVKADESRWTGGRRLWDRDAVESSSEDSFPASDPPSFTPETI